jgi:hypothetical protein
MINFTLPGTVSKQELHAQRRTETIESWNAPGCIIDAMVGVSMAESPTEAGMAKRIVEAATVRRTGADIKGPSTAAILMCGVTGCGVVCAQFKRDCGSMEARSINLPEGGSRDLDSCVRQTDPECPPDLIS